MTYGYDWSVLKGVYGDIIGSAGKVTIGNNVFIEVNSTITKGVYIGNNVIVGANSLISKDIPDNCVVVGNPVNLIMELDEYYEKRKSKQLKEAIGLVQENRNTYGKNPDDIALHEFFFIFSNKDTELTDCWKKMIKLVGNEKLNYKALQNNKQSFSNMDDFLGSI